MAERELPEEIIELMKKKWKERSDKEPEAKKQRIEKRHREGTCKNCNCYRCCHHIWICGKCRIEKERFHVWVNQDKQEKERKVRAKGGGRKGENSGGSRSGENSGGSRPGENSGGRDVFVISQN